MLIRSQDKKDLINLDNIKRLSAGKIYGKDETGWLIELERELSIGQYSTEAKAIKVLDMISSAYDNLNMYHNQPEQGWIYSIFQMPSDEEVEG